ncbi:MAG TPA: SGNH/GDSL hydrolase family protein [Acidimicrobiia bacterium]|nr:SGNH/GDSL hydrolase family protein [Acidimicrobiia bacterium]
MTGLATTTRPPGGTDRDTDLSRLGPGGAPSARRRTARAAGIALRAVVIFAIGGLLWWWGRPLAAEIVVAIGVIVSVASAMSERFATGVETVMRTVAHVVGRVLTFVLLGLLEILIMLPVWLMAKLTRSDPLSLGWSANDSTMWRPGPVSSARQLYRRQFTDERAVRARKHLHYGRLAFPRTRAVLGLVVVLIALDLAVGAGIDAIQRTRSNPTAQQAVVLPLPDSPTREGEPWATKLNAELSAQLRDLQYDPFLGWTLPDYHGEYVNMTDGVRRSYQSSAIESTDPITIAFFGGSAMWGMYQRDEHTIPSEIARLAESDGIPVEVVNYGAGAYVNWQELQLFEQLVAAGARPDLAVFYDGVNELNSQFREGPYTDPTHLQADAMAHTLEVGKAAERGERAESLDARIRESWSDTSATNRIVRGLRRLVSGGAVTPPPDLSAFTLDAQGAQAEDVGTNAAAVLGKGVDVAERLAESYGFRTAFFWQPSLYSKQPGPGDDEARGRWGEDPEAWKVATQQARENLPGSVVDLGNALDVADPVMYDYVHTNELGAAYIAAAMYADLKPTLLELAQSRSR